jgi:hypothetical protein
MTTPHQPASPATGRTCASCGAHVAGRFCAQCGAASDLGNCPSCQSPLSPGARFCHRCGAPTRGGAAGGGRERTAWIIAGAAVVIALLAIIWRTSGAFRPTVPDMANAGNTGADAAAPAGGRAPDISNMTPRERFDKLWDRVFRAEAGNDTSTIIQFAPMALGAYQMLTPPEVDADARYHAAMIHVLVGDFPSAKALADTVLANAPGHLFGYMILGEVADRGNDPKALKQSYKDFMAHYDQELKAGRAEYKEHGPILDDFRTRARAALGQ